jgi:magnesium-protoporphyrin IX monomethyl ester (oxidative) cyclase
MVCERGNFYKRLGMDPSRFDEEVMRHTNRTARRAFPLAFNLEGRTYSDLRDQLVDTFRAIQTTAAEPVGLGRALKGLGLRGRFAALLLCQCCQPMVRSSEAIG